MPLDDDDPTPPEHWSLAISTQLTTLEHAYRELHTCVDRQAATLRTAIDALAARVQPLETLRSILYGVGIGLGLAIGAVLALLPWLVRIGQVLEKKP